MKIGVIGCGRWGTFLAWYLNHIGHTVCLYGRKTSARMRELQTNRANSELKIPDTLKLVTDLQELAAMEMLVVSIGSQSLRALLGEMRKAGLAGKPLVLCMKGIEEESCLRLSEVAAACLPESGVAVWLGPGHVQEFYGGVPNCMVIDSHDEVLKHRLVHAFSSDLIRFYYGQDLLGNEIGAAAKNVIGIAAGVLDGLRLGTLKGALIARGAREIGRLIAAMGGSELSAYGLCHLGDYGATVFSEYSHNRMFGEAFAQGKQYDKLAEGVYTVRALVRLGERYKVELPISSAVYQAVHGGAPVADMVEKLFSRSLKSEFNA